MAERCISCGLSGLELTPVHTIKGRCCCVCAPWVAMSLRRTNRVPKWILPPDSFSLAYASGIRAEFEDLKSSHRPGRWGSQGMLRELGLSWSGPCSERAWTVALDLIRQRSRFHRNDPPNPFTSTPSAKLEEVETNTQMEILSDLGVLYIPQKEVLKEQVAHLMVGNYGNESMKRFRAALFVWVVNDAEFITRGPAWAKGFSFVRQILEELNGRVNSNGGGFQVIGSSRNTYQISPRRNNPHYVITRIVGEKKAQICIDPTPGAEELVLADVIVTLILSLYDDQMSARHIDTLARHVFGSQRNTVAPSLDVNQLWGRVLGHIPVEQRTNMEEQRTNMEPFRRLRIAMDRFQTSIDHWPRTTQEEEE